MDRAGSARCCSGRGWSARSAASSSPWGCAALPAFTHLWRVNAGSGIAAAALALVAFAILACAGLAIIPRYTMLAASILAVFAAVALLGWRLLERGASLAAALAGLRGGRRR